MTDQGQFPGGGPTVCPFVALAEDRDRRADGPDEGNRCYAEPAPRQRDLSYQADYCYTTQFSGCSVFLAWAARSAAEPADVSDAASQAWASGITAPDDGPQGATGDPDKAREGLPEPTPEGGLFGPTDAKEATSSGTSEQLDWVSATAWAEAPWDERAEQEAEELELLSEEEPELPFEEDDEEPPEEATTAPKVPAAMPMRRRKAPMKPVRSRGSGEWYYADPPAHEPLVRRRGVTPTILLAVLGLLVAAIVVFLIPTVLLNGGDDPASAAAVSPSPSASDRPVATRAPVATSAATAEPSATPTPKRRFYRVKSGDSLTSIAQRFNVKPQHLQCINGILNKNIVVLDARYEIPPEGFSCPQGWRNATPGP